MKKPILLLLCLLTWQSLALAQSTHTISGYVSDAESGERLIGATVYLPGFGKGTVTNAYGFYSLTLPGVDTSGVDTSRSGMTGVDTQADSVELIYSYTGYTPERKKLLLSADLRLDVGLVSNNVLQEVEITASPEETQVERVQMSLHKLDMQTVNQAPVLAGEADILKTLQLLPGVSGGNEGSAGLYVRGGSPDQNLILLDGVPVYNVNHVFGFLSVFNTDAINNVDLYKGGIPARYGGRLSSVVVISMKEGNLKESEGVFAHGPLPERTSCGMGKLGQLHLLRPL